MKTEDMLPHHELLCALAGPIGSISLLVLAHVLPKVAVCGIFHFVYNLIPIYPLDGGRVVQACLWMLISENFAEKVVQYIRLLAVIGLFVIAGYASLVLRVGLLPFLAVFVLISKTKIPCKENGLWYNKGNSDK